MVSSIRQVPVTLQTQIPVNTENKILVLSPQGAPHSVGIATIQEYQEADANLKKGFPALSPLMSQTFSELSKIRRAGTSIQTNVNTPLEKIQDLVLREINNLKEQKIAHNAPFGTVVDLTFLKVEGVLIITINGIYDKAFEKPAFATDLPLILHGRHKLDNGEMEEKFFLTAIRRKLPPGQGHFATLGGFNNKTKDTRTQVDIFENALKTAISEGLEEAGFKITIRDSNGKAITDKTSQIFRNFNWEMFSADITLGKGGTKTTLPCVLKNLGFVTTSDELMAKGGERIDERGGKRVDLTQVVGGFVEVPNNIDLREEKVESFFNAGSDAAGICIVDVTNDVLEANTPKKAAELAKKLFKAQEGGILHHEEVINLALSAANKHFNASNSEAPTPTAPRATTTKGIGGWF